MIYGVTGMPLAGKTTVAGLLEKEGFEVVDMGDVVRKEMNKREVPTEETGKWVNHQRKEKGMDAIAQLTAPYIEEKDTEDIVITGMRGLAEKRRFEDELEDSIEMIAVWSSPETRRKRREERMRKEDREGDEFEERDHRDLENGVGRLMALSDYMIINEGLSIEELEEEVNQIV
ncbi:MAG: AAA family ATPase [Candidatus Nanohaloarchaea archaeon]